MIIGIIGKSPGFKKFFECVYPLIGKLNIEVDIINRINFDSDSDSDEIDSDDIESIFDHICL